MHYNVRWCWEPRRKASRASRWREKWGELVFRQVARESPPNRTTLTSFGIEPLMKGTAVRIFGGRAFEVEGRVSAKVLRWVHAYVCRE